MLQLSLQSAKGNDGKAEMFIDYQSESIGFTVIHENKQFDFSIEREEWEQFKNFIETAMKQDVCTAYLHEPNGLRLGVCAACRN